jgi:6-pyruvoyl-tetrahydropterin synthase
MHSIFVNHNMEIAHRLSMLPGKCQKIHGHSMQITLRLDGELDEDGILCGMDFGDLKRAFRNFIDTEFDHRLILNESDPWARQLKQLPEDNGISEASAHYQRLPGLKTTPGDPTTENLSKWICEWAVGQVEVFGITAVHVTIHETGTNGAMTKWSK